MNKKQILAAIDELDADAWQEIRDYCRELLDEELVESEGDEFEE